MTTQLTIDYRAVSHARFWWRNQLGLTARVKPRYPTVNGARVPDELAPKLEAYSNEMLLTRAIRRGLLDVWTPVCRLQLRNSHSLTFSGDKAKQQWKAYNQHIYANK